MTFIPAAQDPTLIEYVTATSQQEGLPAHISWVNMIWIQVTVEASIRHSAVQNRGWMNGTLRAEQRNKTAFKSYWIREKSELFSLSLSLLKIFYPLYNHEREKRTTFFLGSLFQLWKILTDFNETSYECHATAVHIKAVFHIFYKQ
jgi:hypothetical protein